MKFIDREDAGRRLAAKLEGLRLEHPVVLGLARGGMPVAFEVARLLGAALDMAIVRKLRAPALTEHAVGAIAEGGETFLNPIILREAGLASDEAAAIAEDEVDELTRRVRLYRGERKAPVLEGRVVVVVDDGVTTGASARAAGRAARHRGARRVVLAVPVVPAGLEGELRRDFDEVVALEMPAHLPAIADWYDVFEEVTDAMVVRYIKRAGEELAATMKSGLPWSGE